MSIMQYIHTFRRSSGFYRIRRAYYTFAGGKVVSKVLAILHTRARRAGATVGIFVIAFVMLLSFVFNSIPISAQTRALSSEDIQSGTSEYGEIDIRQSGTQLALQRGSVGKWDPATSSRLQNIPHLTRTTVSMAYGPNNMLYHLSGFSGECYFHAYDTERHVWDTTLKSVPVGCGSGAQIVSDKESYVYYLPGNSSGKFFRYDIAKNSWTTLSTSPAQISDISSVIFVENGNNDMIFAFRGGSSTAFSRYNVATNQWQFMTPFPTSADVSNGITMTWDGADTIYVLANNSTSNNFRKYSITTNTWTNLPNTNATSCSRLALSYKSGVVYAVRINICFAADQLSFISYNVASNTWTDLAPPATGANDYDWASSTFDGSRYIYTQLGAEYNQKLLRYDTVNQTWNDTTLLPSNSVADWVQSMIYDGSQNVYYLGSSGQGGVDRLYRYNLSTKQAVQISTQLNTQNGFKGVHTSGSLYLLPRGGNTTFVRYDTASDAWVNLAAAPFEASWGSEIVDGGNGNLYVTFGGRANFYRYNIAANTWTALTSLPVAPGPGGGMTRVGTKLYVMNGNQTAFMHVYDIAANTWAAIQGAPNGGINHGGFVTGDGSRYLYINTGTRTEPANRRLFRFDTTNNTWLRLADTPTHTSIGASAFYDTSAEKLYVSPGWDSPHLWSWSSTSTQFVTSGTWYSRTINLEQVQAWQSLQRIETGSGIAVYTRTSANGRLWTDWQQVNGTQIASQTNKYAQLKIVLTGDGTATPTVSGIAFEYDQEALAPNLPSQFSAKSVKGGDDLISGETYEWQHPYFSWSGADDGVNGSGVDGYYVYFGTDSGANPEVDGTYQSNTDYTVTTPMSAGDVYYLRIKVKDKLGTVSAAATYFSYRYFYISPHGSEIRTSDTDLAAGDNIGMTIADGALSLRRQDAGAWSTGTTEMLPDTGLGVAAAVVNDDMYILRGASTQTFWKYNTVNRTWQTLPTLPASASLGSSLTWDKGNYLYAIRGTNSTGFYRYSIRDSAWETLPLLPVAAQTGTDIAHIGGNKIAFYFAGVREFYFYDTEAQTFAIKQSYPDRTTASGSGIWFDGDDTVYAYIGGDAWWAQSNNTRPTLIKYSIQADSWRTLANAPIATEYAQNNLVGDGKGGLYITSSNIVNSISKNNMMQRYDIATDTWSEVDGLEAQMYYSSATSDNSRYLYYFPSTNNQSRKIIRYDTQENIFTPQSKSIDKWERVPWDASVNAWLWEGGTATTAAYDGSKYLYVLGRDEGNWSQFIRFDYTTGSTQYISTPPSVGLGGSLTFISNELYYLKAANTRELYKYDRVADVWQRMADAPGAIYRPGPSSFISMGSTAFALAGNGRTAYTYTPNGSGGTWSQRADAPGTILNGSAVYDGSNYIYVLASNGTTNFYRYNIAGNSWSAIAALPQSTALGNTMVLHNGKIYATLGNTTKSTYVYTISSNTWDAGAGAPEQIRVGAMALKASNTKAIVFPGDNSPDYWEFVLPDTDRAYSGYATHTSQPMTFAGLFDYAGLSVELNQPQNTKAEFYTRTSDDGNQWSDWQATTDNKRNQSRFTARVASTPKKFIQIKIALYSYDNVSSPTVQSYALNYYYDVDPPTNPNVFTAYSDETKGTELTSNSWYNHSRPYFDWPDPGDPGGATDGPLGSNIAGYWVYVGTDDTAVPQTAGIFVSTSHYQPTLSLSGTYHVRIQAQDITGNVDSNIYQPFAYKFDNQPPVNPVQVTVTPGGFTTINKYKFDWPAAYDAHSGVASYCYHTGATSGPFADEICQSGRDLVDLSAAYRTGTNVFYLRTKDNAGNFSTSPITVSYYYSTDPPSPPTNVRAIPPSNPQNLFAFAWDLPSLYSGDPDQLNYCYSVNSLPSSLNTTCTDQRFISSFKAATQQGTNILYIVTKDEAGNVNWNNYASAVFIANTVSPGIPVNITVSDTSDRTANRWALTVTWDRPEFEGNGIDSYIVERSLDGNAFTQLGRTTTRAFVDLDVEAGTLYYYRVRAADGVDNRGGPSGSASGSPKGNFTSPPTIIVQPTSNADSSQASIRWATNRPATSFVYYGTSPTNLSQSRGSLIAQSEHEQTLTGLQPSTTYYYRVQSFDNDRNYNVNDATSPIFSLRTNESARIFEVSADDITLSSGVINWQTSVAAKTVIEYGLTPSYGSTTSAEGATFATSHLQKLSGLASGATYHYRIVATTSFGSKLYSDDYTFTTIARPSISTVRFQPIDDEATTAVKVTWQTNVPTSSTVRYSGTGSTQEETTSELTTDHEMIIRDLASSTDYAFMIDGRDQYGNLATSETQKWRSTYDTRAPKVSNVSYGTTTIQGGSTTKAQLIVSWTTDEPATSQVTFGQPNKKNSSKSTPLDTEPTTKHVVVISNLKLADIYAIQVVSRDISGNIARSTGTSVVTPDKETSVLDNVLTIMQKVFRF
jgi:Purple acid Phosphatase, N-terminal domain